MTSSACATNHGLIQTFYRTNSFSLFAFSSSCSNYVFTCLLKIFVIHSTEYKLPSLRKICICMLVYAYENEVLKKLLLLSLLNILREGNPSAEAGFQGALLLHIHTKPSYNLSTYLQQMFEEKLKLS